MLLDIVQKDSKTLDSLFKCKAQCAERNLNKNAKAIKNLTDFGGSECILHEILD